MPLFYRGDGVGTYWHQRDARADGFVPWHPGGSTSVHHLIRHIVNGTVVSPFVSLTRSWGVALAYATLFSRSRPSSGEPAFVYEVEIEDASDEVRVLDPIVEIARTLPAPLDSHSYHHDGLPDFLLGVVSAQTHAEQRKQPYPQPPPGGGTPRPPQLSVELEALVRVLRDAEVLVVGAVPARCVSKRYNVW